tara:strand:+ start:2230 stop:2571 length:342 start_codon:yes stop_codon:yes gene_type:complete
MLAYFTPAPVYPMIRNELLNDLQRQHVYEIVTFPMHYPDELCMNELRRNTDPNVILYIALMKGITPIVTVGDHKSFVADLSKPKVTKKNSRKLPRDRSEVREKLETNLKKKRD